jgi:alkylation response protein AidB-like acyl-CoA dehydrogenase
MLELKDYPQSQTIDWLALAESIGQQCGSEELLADDSDCFVAKNFSLLKESGLTGAGVPVEFGGGGASYREICDILRILGRHCSSTALALSMHTHQVMVNVWKWQHQNAPVEGLLRRIAREQIMLLSTGGGDWLDGSGTATLTEGGFIINACKSFVSGVPAGDILITSAVYEDPTAGKTVLHFALPMNTPGVSIEPVWQAMGMRGTGSHNVRLSNVFVPEQKIALQRPAGKWHPAFHLITAIAIPIVYSVYVGIAEAARNLLVRQASKRQNDFHTCYLVGGLENELATAKLALQRMIALSESNQPSLTTTNQVMMGRTIVAKSVLNTMDLAMEIAGGRAFQRSFGLEKLFRDAQGVRYHPLREEVQRQLAGKLALGVSTGTL